MQRNLSLNSALIFFKIISNYQVKELCSVRRAQQIGNYSSLNKTLFCCGEMFPGNRRPFLRKSLFLEGNLIRNSFSLEK